MMMAMIENKSERREISFAHVFTPEIFRSTVAKLKMVEKRERLKSGGREESLIHCSRIAKTKKEDEKMTMRNVRNLIYFWYNIFFLFRL